MASIYLISLEDTHYSLASSLSRLLAYMPLFLPEKTLHLLTGLFATCCLVRMTLFEEGTASLDEQKLSFWDDDCCSPNRQMSQRSEGVLDFL